MIRNFFRTGFGMQVFEQIFGICNSQYGQVSHKHVIQRPYYSQRPLHRIKLFNPPDNPPDNPVNNPVRKSGKNRGCINFYASLCRVWHSQYWEIHQPILAGFHNNACTTIKVGLGKARGFGDCCGDFFDNDFGFGKIR